MTSNRATLGERHKAGRAQDIYLQTRLYAGKRRFAGILYLRDPAGNPLDPPEERTTEWTSEFKFRSNPHVQVRYECISEASEEEWQDNSRDDDATPSDPPL